MSQSGNVRGFVILSRIDFMRRRWVDLAEAHCATVCGWLEKADTMSAGRKPPETSCSARGGAFCEYECSWE